MVESWTQALRTLRKCNLPSPCACVIHNSPLEWDYPFGGGPLGLPGGPSFFCRPRRQGGRRICLGRAGSWLRFRVRPAQLREKLNRGLFDKLAFGVGVGHGVLIVSVFLLEHPLPVFSLIKLTR